MYCCHCGKERDLNEKDICTSCGVPFSDERAIRFCEHCGNHISEDTEVCSNCGSNLLVPILKDTSYKCSAIKAISSELVNNKNVNKKLIYGVFYLLPSLIISGIVSSLLHIFASSSTSLLISYVLTCIVSAIFGSYILLKVVEVIKTGKAKWNFKIHTTLNISMFVLSFVIGGINLLLSLFLTPNIQLLSTGNLLFFELINIIILIIFCFIYWFFFFGLYIYESRNFPLMESIKLGFKYGFKSLDKLIVLGVSFIPLFLLCCITFGILFIWKGFYIVTTGGLLMEKVLQDNNI